MLVGGVFKKGGFLEQGRNSFKLPNFFLSGQVGFLDVYYS